MWPNQADSREKGDLDMKKQTKRELKRRATSNMYKCKRNEKEKGQKREREREITRLHCILHEAGVRN